MAFDLPISELHSIFGNQLPPIIQQNQPVVQHQTPPNGIIGTGDITLNGHKFALNNGNNTVDGIPVNSPSLALQNGEIVYWDADAKQFKKLAGSSVLGIILDAVDKAKNPPIPISQVEKNALNNTLIDQIEQFKPKTVDISTDQLVKPVEKDRITLFENPMSILLLVGFGVLVYNSIKK